jgi:LytR cell envelope-related transcriptional attenuator
VEFAQLLERPFPWRTATLVAAAVALVELVGLLALAGVRLAPIHRSTPDRAAAAAPQTPATHARPARTLTRTPAARTHPLRTRSQISVLVLNGNGVPHAAGNLATRLLAHGYRHAVPADAPSHGYARSLVLFRPGYAREAHRLAREIGIRAVSPLDGMRPSQLRGSQLVVILGGS